MSKSKAALTYEIAAMVALLVGPGGRFATGASVAVDGGLAT